MKNGNVNPSELWLDIRVMGVLGAPADTPSTAAVAGMCTITRHPSMDSRLWMIIFASSYPSTDTAGTGGASGSTRGMMTTSGMGLGSSAGVDSGDGEVDIPASPRVLTDGAIVTAVGARAASPT